MQKKVCAVIVAAGSSSRMGKGVSKQRMYLCGEPILSYTIKAFENSQRISDIVIVCREEDFDFMHRISGGFSKVKKITRGGNSRQESVALGVECTGDCDIIAIHDGARPLITPEKINLAIEDCEKYRASSLAVRVVDTIKEVDDDEFVVNTPDRSSLRAVQTPQVFFKEEYNQALKKAKADGKDFTDDCQLIEYFGTKVHLCEGDRSNIKITTLEDITYAEAILESRKKSDNL